MKQIGKQTENIGWVEICCNSTEKSIKVQTPSEKISLVVYWLQIGRDSIHKVDKKPCIQSFIANFLALAVCFVPLERKPKNYQKIKTLKGQYEITSYMTLNKKLYRKFYNVVNFNVGKNVEWFPIAMYCSWYPLLDHCVALFVSSPTAHINLFRRCRCWNKANFCVGRRRFMIEWMVMELMTSRLEWTPHKKRTLWKHERIPLIPLTWTLTCNYIL